MIPDLAVVVGAYAFARLANEYLLLGEKWTTLRQAVAALALVAVVLFTLDIVMQSGTLPI